MGQIELLRDPPGKPSPRFRMTFDPVFDLALVRATYAFRRALRARAARFHEPDGAGTGLPGSRRWMRPSFRCSIAWSSISRSILHQRAYLAQAEATPSPASREAPRRAADDLEEPGRARSDRDRASRSGAGGDGGRDPRGRLSARQGALGRRRIARRPCGFIWASPRRPGTSGSRASQVPRPAVRDARLAAAILAEGQTRPGAAGLRAGPQGRSRALRGAVWPGDPRAGRGPGLGRLRERPGRDRVGTERRRSLGGPRHRLGGQPVCPRRGQRRGAVTKDRGLPDAILAEPAARTRGVGRWGKRPRRL